MLRPNVCMAAPPLAARWAHGLAIAMGLPRSLTRFLLLAAMRAKPKTGWRRRAFGRTRRQPLELTITPSPLRPTPVLQWPLSGCALASLACCFLPRLRCPGLLKRTHEQKSNPIRLGPSHAMALNRREMSGFLRLLENMRETQCKRCYPRVPENLA